MDQSGMEANIAEDAQLDTAITDTLGTLAANLDHVEVSLVEATDAINAHALSIEHTMSKQDDLVRAVNDIVDEINLIWDALDQPWYRRMFRTGRAKARARYTKEQT